ncbi:protein white-like [Schistocerca gregaria]|uniref:protein white-like n=1 Tax=Schistocerca gregaria TaxID=7010 RepID=UPI00211F4437|nr:protein white-like [Schistocerca gregaria]XP_049837354.1 protein white-like [Schistocerca gregaria]
MHRTERQPLLRARPRQAYRATDDFASVALDMSDLSTAEEVSSCAEETADSLAPAAPKRKPPGLTYTWRGLRAYGSSARGPGQDGRPLLRDVSGQALPGELLAVMGASGAGKTSLLEALTFRAALHAGERLLNGRPADAAHLAAHAAYVAQQNYFVGALTVREHLIFHALLRMDRHFPYDLRLKRVEELISEFSLTDCQHVTIGIAGRIRGISGGEMKRLAFAAEVLTDPPLMFCDEPTSGLDSFMALAVATALKAMARKGKTVVATVHQPSSEMYALFDRLLLIAEGRVAFQGTPDQALAFFSSMGATCPAGYNPADFFLHLLAVVPDKEAECRSTIELLCDNFQRSPGAKVAACNGQHANGDSDDEQVVALVAAGRGSSPYKTGWCDQMRAVLWRSWLSVIKEPVLIKMRMLQTMMISLMIGIVFYGQSLNEESVMNINGAIIIFITNMTFQNIFAVITVFCSEMPVFLHEHRSGMYRVDVYFLAKTLAELPIFSAIPCLFTVVSYYLVGLNPAPERFFCCMLIAILVTNVATSFGYFVSCASSSISVAMSMAQPLIFPFLLFGGFFLNVRSVPAPLEWLARLSWFRYGNEAMFVNQWAGVEHIECSSNATCPASGHVVLQTVDFDEADFMEDLLGLTALAVGLRVLALVALLARTRRGSR